MPFIDLASFPNSRIKPRSATQISEINNVELAPSTATLVRPIDPDRTVCTIGNQSGSISIRYLRGTSDDIDTKGYILLPGQAIDLEGPQSIWLYAEGGSVLVTYDDGRG